MTRRAQGEFKLPFSIGGTGVVKRSATGRFIHRVLTVLSPYIDRQAAKKAIHTKLTLAMMKDRATDFTQRDGEQLCEEITMILVDKTTMDATKLHEFIRDAFGDLCEEYRCQKKGK